MVAAAKKMSNEDKAYYLVAEEVFRPIFEKPFLQAMTIFVDMARNEGIPYFYKARGLKLLNEIDDFFVVLDCQNRRLILDRSPRTEESPAFIRSGREVFAPSLEDVYFPPIKIETLKDETAPPPIVYIDVNEMVLEEKAVHESPMIYEMNTADFHLFYERDYERGSRRKPHKKESKGVRKIVWGWLAPDLG